MSSQRTLADYRPQHDGDCSIYCCVQCSERQNDFHHWSPPVDAPNKWVRHSFQPRSCSCGLSALLSPPLSDSERVTCHTPMLWAVLTEDQKYEEYLRVRSLLSPPPVTPEEEQDQGAALTAVDAERATVPAPREVRDCGVCHGSGTSLWTMNGKCWNCSPDEGNKAHL